MVLDALHVAEEVDGLQRGPVDVDLVDAEVPRRLEPECSVDELSLAFTRAGDEPPVAELVVRPRTRDLVRRPREVTRRVDAGPGRVPVRDLRVALHDQVDRQPERPQQQRVVAERGDVAVEVVVGSLRSRRNLRGIDVAPRLADALTVPEPVVEAVGLRERDAALLRGRDEAARDVATVPALDELALLVFEERIEPLVVVVRGRHRDARARRRAVRADRT